MRKSNLLTRSGTAALILAMLGVTAPIFSTATAEPILEAVIKPVPNTESFTEKKRAETLPPETLPPETMLPETSPPAVIKKPTVEKLAEVKPKAARRSNLAPMRLRMTPRFTNEQLAEIETHRWAVAGGNEDAKKDLKTAASNVNFMNRHQISISSAGEAFVEISKGNGGWPGFPARNTDWIKRPLSSEMKQGVKSTMSKCAASKGPVYFTTTITQGDADIGKGTFEVECVPGGESKRAQYNKIDLAEAFLASDTLPLSTRQNNFQWRYAFARFETYVITNPNTTIARDRAECVKIYTELKQNYGFTERHRKGADHHLGRCATIDYNWVRKRENIPEVQ